MVKSAGAKKATRLKKLKKRKAKTGKNVLDLYFTENHANPAMRVNVRHHAIEEDNTLIEITTRQGGTHYSHPDASKNINFQKKSKRREASTENILK